MALTISDISQAGITFLSLFAGLLKKIAPPERVAGIWTGIASLIAGGAFLSVKLLAHINSNPASFRFWGIVALSSVALSMVLCFIYISALQTRTVSYADDFRIIGTELTPAGQKYVADNANWTREQMLFDAAGETEKVWTPDSAKRARFLLGAEYSLFIASLAFGLNLGVEILSNDWRGNTPPPQKPTLQQQAADLKDVHFALDRNDLQEDAAERLSEDAAILVRMVQQFPKMRVIVAGHCDDRGSLKRNLELGYARARTVGDGLVRAGISADKLQLASYGKGSPVCSEASEPCMRRNRRVHLTVLE
jgi:outer membrane protein OmpA-like peptidoglycan-associated protein